MINLKIGLLINHLWWVYRNQELREIRGIIMIEYRKILVFIFVAILLIYMIRLFIFTKEKWKYKSYTIYILITGIVLVFFAALLDMLEGNIQNNSIYRAMIPVFFTLGAIVYVMGVIMWTKVTIQIMNKLEKLPLTDAMTGVLNRYGIEKLFKSTVETGKPFYVVICDLNGVKKINDTYGHIEGDKYINVATKIITRVIGLKEHMSRIGGDEFILLLEDLDKSKLEQNFCVIKSEISKIHPEAHTGISIGYALYPEEGINFKKLIKIADKKMYEDKKKQKSIQN